MKTGGGEQASSCIIYSNKSVGGKNQWAEVILESRGYFSHMAYSLTLYLRFLCDQLFQDLSLYVNEVKRDNETLQLIEEIQSR